VIGNDEMTVELTPEKVFEMGKMWGSAYLSTLNVEEVLPYFKRQDILAQFQPVERLAGLEPESIEDYLKQLKRQQH
jgi:hypothetical protein